MSCVVDLGSGAGAASANCTKLNPSLLQVVWKESAPSHSQKPFRGILIESIVVNPKKMKIIQRAENPSQHAACVLI